MVSIDHPDLLFQSIAKMYSIGDGQGCGLQFSEKFDKLDEIRKRELKDYCLAVSGAIYRLQEYIQKLEEKIDEQT